MKNLNPWNHLICFVVPNRITLHSAWHEHIPFAMFLVYLLRPKIIVELGTQYGDSYCAFCQAVKELHLDTACYAVDTWHGDPQSGLYGPEILADLRAHHDPLYSSFSRLIQSTFDEALEHFAGGTVDLLHIDGYHTYESVRHDFESWLPKMSSHGVVLFHDTNVRERDFGIRKFWEEVKLKYPHFEFLHGHGLGVLAVGKVRSKELQKLFELPEEESIRIRDFFFQLGYQLTTRVQNKAMASELENQKRQLQELKAGLKYKDVLIANLEASLQELEYLEYQLQHSIVMQLINRYQRIVERLLRTDTRRRYYYELMLSGIRVILSEGWGSFFRRARYRLAHRPATIKKPRRDLPKFNASISEREAGKLVFPMPSDKPDVSIVIPAYNKWQYTLNCLKSIAENTDGDYEVLVIDDASTDETAEVLSKIKNLHLVTHKQNAGFVESCNHGARASKGKNVLFLNNDTMVTKGWLSPLLELIKGEDVGAAGSKLVYPDGTLQEAGAIIWNDGTALNYGRGDDESKPEYNYVRDVDYISGAALLVKRELFEKLDGFDERFKPGYCEDSDLCLSLRNLGYRVMYQPMSVVVHFEGVTCGTDVSSGIRRYQAVNYLKLVSKWYSVLEADHKEPQPDNILSARDRRTGKTLLIVDDRVPASHLGSGYPRAREMLRFLSEFGLKVTLFPLQDSSPWQPYTNELQQLGIEVFYGDNLNFAQFAKDRKDCYDLVLVSRLHNMKQAFYKIKRFFPKATLLYDAEAIFSVREVLKARVKGDERMEKAAEGMMNQELNLVKKADLIITVSENERKVIAEKTGLNNVMVWGHPVAVKEPQTPFNERRDILFVGGFSGRDSPNEDAIIHFAKEIFPKLEGELSCRLFIVGTNPPKSVRKLSSSSVIVTGYVENLGEYYEKCRVFVVPHRYSAGIPLKLLEALGHGIPSVVSELTAAQLNLIDGKEVLVAGNADEFAAKIIRLYKNSDLWYQLQRNSLDYVKQECSPEALKASLKQIIDTACMKPNHAPV